jgi:hypothetical protein
MDKNFTTLMDSRHGDAFAGKLVPLFALVRKYPDRDFERAVADLIEKVDVIKYDSKAMTLLESFVQKAPRVAQREPERSAGEIRHSLMLDPRRTCGHDECSICGGLPNLAVEPARIG